jgi:hypothetical protein
MGLFGRKNATGQSIRTYTKTKRKVDHLLKAIPKRKKPPGKPTEKLTRDLMQDLAGKSGTAAEEAAFQVYQRQIRQILTRQGPQSSDWQRIIKSVERSRDEDYLAGLRGAAESIWDWQSHAAPTPGTIEVSIDDLVRHIDARLRVVAPGRPEP